MSTLGISVHGNLRAPGRRWVRHERREDHRVVAVFAGVGIAAVARRPDVDVVALPTQEHVAVDRSEVLRAADHDVAAGARDEDVVAEISAKQIVVATPEQHVGVVHVLLGHYSWRLDERVCGVVVVESLRDVLCRRTRCHGRYGCNARNAYAGNNCGDSHVLD